MKLILWSSFNIQNKRFCSSSKNKGTYANDAKNVNKDSPIERTGYETRKISKGVYKAALS